MQKDTHPPLAGHPLAEVAVDAWLAGVAAGDPTKLVRQAVRQGRLDAWLGDLARPKQIHVLAIGKAAPAMLWGLVEAGVPFKGLGVAPRGVQAPTVDTFEWLAGEHPVPGNGSFEAGRRIMAWIDALPHGAPVLVLLSGGASSLCEVPLGDRAAFVADWTRWLHAGLSIEAMNQRRAAASSLKGGKLGRRLQARTATAAVWLLCDTDPAHPEAVGSGPFAGTVPAIPHHVLATADTILQGAALRLGAAGWTAFRHPGRIEGHASTAIEGFLAGLSALPTDQDVALLGCGETSDALPANAPMGGRCAHAAALAAARAGFDVFAALASDGIDGTTPDAGAWVVAGDGGAAFEQASAAFAAHGELAARGRTVRFGATGTNLNDLWVALRKAR